jgi:hypothetical protein
LAPRKLPPSLFLAKAREPQSDCSKSYLHCVAYSRHFVATITVLDSAAFWALLIARWDRVYPRLSVARNAPHWFFERVLRTS